MKISFISLDGLYGRGICGWAEQRYVLLLIVFKKSWSNSFNSRLLNSMQHCHGFLVLSPKPPNDAVLSGNGETALTEARNFRGNQKAFKRRRNAILGKQILQSAGKGRAELKDDSKMAVVPIFFAICLVPRKAETIKKSLRRSPSSC